MKKMDKGLEKLVRGLTPGQVKVMASVLAGMADSLTKKRAAESLRKWKRRNDYRWN